MFMLEIKNYYEFFDYIGQHLRQFLSRIDMYYKVIVCMRVISSCVSFVGDLEVIRNDGNLLVAHVY
jgi:hypothetical protein